MGSANWVTIGLGNDLSPVPCQAITWIHAELMWIEPQGMELQWNFNPNANISVKKVHLKMLSADYLPFWPGLNVLTITVLSTQLPISRGSIVWGVMGGYNSSFRPYDADL